MAENICEEFCVAIGKVPNVLPKENLLKCIEKLSSTSVEKWTTIEGAENDRNYERLLVKLNSKPGVKRLYEDLRHEEIEHEGENYTIVFEKCIGCEIPLDWEDEDVEMDGDPDPAEIPPRSQSSRSQDSGLDVPNQSGASPHPSHFSQMTSEIGGGTFYQNVPNPGQDFTHAHQGFNTPGQGQAQQPIPQMFPFPLQMFQPYQQPGDGQNLQQQLQEQYDPRPFQEFLQQFGMQQGQPYGQAFPGQSEGTNPTDPPPPYTSGGELMMAGSITELKGPIGGGQAVADQEEGFRRLNEKAEREKQTRNENYQKNDGNDDEDDGCQNSKCQTTKLVVKDLPTSVQEDFIELYFEKLGKDEVVRIEMDEDQRMALVEFKEPEAVERVLNGIPVKIRNTELRVRPFYEEKEEEVALCTVEVHGLNGIDASTVEMYFENTKRSGGDDIGEIDYDEEEGRALITYKSEEIARRVADKGNHILSKQPLEVTLWQPLPKKSWNVSTPEPEPEPEFEPADTIEVRGIDESIDKETLEMYFESKKRSGGDEIQRIEIQGTAVYITYTSEEVAQRVVDKGDHYLNRLRLDVTLFRQLKQPGRSRERSVTPEPVRTIEVLGIDESIDEATLEMYFENTKRSGGGEIETVDADYEEGIAYITFAEEEVAERVISKERHILNKKPLQVQLTTQTSMCEEIVPPEPLCTVEVQGITPSIDQETLEMYFENSKRSGGGDIANVDIDKDERIAHITFNEEEVAQRVVERGKHVLNRIVLKVAIYQPQGQTQKSAKGSNAEGSESSLGSMDEKQGPTSVVKVKGVKRVTSTETMLYYFENKRRSDGGEIKQSEKHEEDDDIFFITFSEPEVAKKVADREHVIEGTQLEVSLHIPPKPRPYYEDKVLIRGLKSTTTKDCLFNFLEAKSGSVPLELLRGEKEGVVLITFESQPDVSKLVEVCNRYPLEGGKLEVSQVQVTNCIIVLHLPENVTKDTVWFYFENKRRSDGGPIDKVLLKEDECTCLVYFEDYKVVDRVIRKTHKIGEQVLTVNVYLECLGCPQGDDTEKPLKLPDAIVITDLDVKKVKFMVNSEVNRKAIACQMEPVFAELKWPDKESKPKNVIIKCTLTEETKDVRNLAKSWKQTATNNFNDFMKNIVLETCSVNPEYWNQVMENVKSIQIPNPDAVAILVDRDQGGICTVGFKKVVENLSKDIAISIKQIEDQLEMEKEKTKETLTTLKLIETKMLLAEKYPNKMESKYPGLKVKINQNKNEIVFDGLLGDIKNAKLDMFNYKENFAVGSVEMENCRLKFSLYENKPVKDYIVKKLKSSQVTAVWQVKDQTLQVCCGEAEKLGKAVTIVKESIVEHNVTLSKENVVVVESESWASMLHEQNQKYPGRIAVDTSGKMAYVCGTDDIADEFLEVLKKFLRTNTIIEDHVDFTKSMNRLIEKNHKQDIERISKKYASLNTQIVTKVNNAGFTLLGTAEGLEQVKKEMNSIKLKIITKTHTLESPGIAGHMESKGHEHMNTVEKSYPVVFDNPEEGDSDREYEVQLLMECTAYDDRKIYTAEGDMTELSVDVLVNAADSKLSMTGGVGKAIISKGGKEIERACRDYIQDEGELGEGEAFTTTAGNLKAKYIVHIVGPVWRSGHNNEESLLAETVLKSMKQATVKNVKSIALPAISCGVYGFPARRATKVIVQSVKNFFREMQDSSITEVYLCDVKSNTVKGFAEALEMEFGKRNMRIVDHSRQNLAAARPKRPKIVQKSSKKTSMPTNFHSAGGSSDESDGPQTLPLPMKGVRIGNITLMVITGEIGKQSVDVIVNTTARNLDLKNGAVSQSLLRAAGTKLQQEVSNKYPNGIKDGEIAVTSGQALKCRCIIHTSLMNWDGKNAEAKNALHTLMNNCLNEADTNNYNSIAFPAIGTGNLGFPRDVVAKEMFTVISNFAKKNPRSNITDVKFIVYEKDTGTISAFNAEEKRWKDRRESRQFQLNPQFANFKVGHQDSESEDTDGSCSNEETDSGTDENAGYKLLSVKVEKGDITKVKCDCIVNSSNDSLDLSTGAVSQALMKIGGQELKAECKAKVHAMKADHIVMTKAPGFPFKHIIHVVAQETAKSWKKMADRCFLMAEGHKINSIAFPALGTNIHGNPAEIANVLVGALREFEAKQHFYLREVQFVIYKSEMVDIFKKALENTKKPKKGFLSTVYAGLTGSFGRNTEQPKKPKKTRKKTKHKQEVERPDQYPIRVHSMSQTAIDDAIKRLEDLIKNEIHSQVFKDPLLKNLNEIQRKQLKTLEKEFNVQIKFKGSDSLELSGMIKNMMDASNKIHSVIRDLDRYEHQANEAKRLTQLVQWFFIEILETKQELLPYDPTVNMLIENAYNDQKPTVAFSDSEGKKYIIDFAKMHEYPEGDPTDSVNVIRRDNLKQGAFNMPDYWNDMGSENLKVVTLQNTDQEFQDIAKQFQTSVGSTNFEVTRVDRIQNKTLWTQYNAKKKLLDDTNKSSKNESMLWHGTAVDTVDSINANGFNRSYCGKNATAFGDGVYFAVNASYSCSDTYSRPDSTGTKRMYLCQVLTGEFTLGKNGMRVPPPKQGSSSSLYDSVVNNVSSPTMYIIFHDTQAYPQYLILFKKK